MNARSTETIVIERSALERELLEPKSRLGPGGHSSYAFAASLQSRQAARSEEAFSGLDAFLKWCIFFFLPSAPFGGERRVRGNPVTEFLRDINQPESQRAGKGDSAA